MHLTLIILSVLGGTRAKNVLLIIADDAGLEVGSSIQPYIIINY